MHRRRRGGGAAVLLEPQLLAPDRIVSEIATPQIIWFQNPASNRKSPGLLQLPLLPPGAAQFLASRLETDGVEPSMLAL